MASSGYGLSAMTCSRSRFSASDDVEFPSARQPDDGMADRPHLPPGAVDGRHEVPYDLRPGKLGEVGAAGAVTEHPPVGSGGVETAEVPVGNPGLRLVRVAVFRPLVGEFPHVVIQGAEDSLGYHTPVVGCPSWWQVGRLRTTLIWPNTGSTGDVRPHPRWTVPPCVCYRLRVAGARYAGTPCCTPIVNPIAHGLSEASSQPFSTSTMGVRAVGMCVLDAVISSSSSTWITFRHMRIRTLSMTIGQPHAATRQEAHGQITRGTASPPERFDRRVPGNRTIETPGNTPTSSRKAPHADHSLTTPTAHMACVEDTVLDAGAQVTAMITGSAQDNAGVGRMVLRGP